MNEKLNQSKIHYYNHSIVNKPSIGLYISKYFFIINKNPSIEKAFSQFFFIINMREKVRSMYNNNI